MNAISGPLQPAVTHHRDGVVHATRADAEADTEHFDGCLSATDPA